MIAAEQKTSLEKKIDRFREICEQSPGELTPILALGEASLRRGLRLEALKAFQQVTKSQEAVAEAHLAIAQIFSQQRMIGEAYDEIARVLEWEPDNVEARLLATELSRGQEPPPDIVEFLASIPPFGAIERARGRLKVLQRLAEREYQERTRNASLEPGEPLQEYHVEEARRRLDDLNRQLEALESLEEDARRRQLEPPTADLVPPQSYEVDEPEPEPDFGQEHHQVVPGPDLELYPEAHDEPPVVSFEEPISPAPEHEEPVPVMEYEEPPSFEPAAAELPDLDLEGAYPSVEAPEAVSEFEPPAPEKPDLELDFSHQETPQLDFQPAFSAPEEEAVASSSLEFEVPEPPSLEPDFGVPEPVVDFEPEIPTPAEVPPMELEAPTPEIPVAPAAAPSVGPPELEIPADEPEVSSAGPSEARLDFYGSLSADIAELTSTLSKTRGVTSIFVVERSGYMLEHSSRDDVTPERISSMIVEALEFLEAFAPEPQYWVLECNGGILVMQTIDQNHVLVAIGQAGANFGALRYTMDKTRARFAELLAGLPD